MENTLKYEDLKCEFCDGCGEFSRDNSDGVAVEGDCSFCNGTGTDQDQLHKLFMQTFSSQNPCAMCGCSMESHSDEMICPSYCAGAFMGWLETKFTIR